MDSKLLKVCMVMLAAMGLSACDDDDSSSDKNTCDTSAYVETCVDASTLSTCVNGKIEKKTCENGCENNACKAAEAQCTTNVCKDATTLTVCNNGVPVDQPCANGCENNACKAETPATCGNGKLDDGEVCDGTVFADNARVCPEGTVLATGKTVNDITCSAECSLVTTGVCAAESTPVVPDSGTVKEGDACDETFEEFCDANGNTVYCSEDGVVGVYECAKGCKIVDLSDLAGEEYISAACSDDDLNKQCTKVGDEIPYCSTYTYAGEEYPLAGSYYCAQAKDKSLVAVDLSEYGQGDICDGTTCGIANGAAYCMESCDKENEEVTACVEYYWGLITTAYTTVCQKVDGKLLAVPTTDEVICNNSCEEGKGCVIYDETEGQTCDADKYVETCNGTDEPYLLYCYEDYYGDATVAAYPCDEGTVCLTIPGGNRADCYDKEVTAEEKCTTEGESKNACVDSYYSYIGKDICTKMSDGTLRYVFTAEDYCDGECNDAGTACAE